MKKIIAIICFVLVIIFFTSLDYEVGGIGNHQILSENSFVDDSGIIVKVLNNNLRIVSLSPTHTENIYEIGAGSVLIGVDNQSIYPIEALNNKSFDLSKQWDVQELIKLNPDYVIVEPKQKEKKRKLIATLESEGIIVVSILPESMETFDEYIKKLGIMTNHLSQAIKRLNEYNEQLEDFQILLKEASIDQDKTILIETSENGYFIPSEDHMIAKAATMAGGKVLFKRATILSRVVDQQIKVGLDFMIQDEGPMDSYFSVTGPGYSGADLISISQKDEFKKLQVFKDGQVYNISSELIGKYTFRYLKGIKEFHRLMYQEDSLIKSFNMENLNEPLTRLRFTKILYDYYTLPTYVNEDVHYYEFSKFIHTYGGYKDITYRHPCYDIVETVTMKGYIQPIRNSENIELFEENHLITKDDLIMFLVIRLNINKEEGKSLLKSLYSQDKSSYTSMDLLKLLETIEDEVYDD